MHLVYKSATSAYYPVLLVSANAHPQPSGTGGSMAIQSQHSADIVNATCCPGRLQNAPPSESHKLAPLYFDEYFVTEPYVPSIHIHHVEPVSV